MAGGQDREMEEIQCSPAVTHQDINRYCDYCPQRCDKCRRVMQNALQIVTKTEESVRKNFQITCYCEHFSLCFSSGKRENEIVVQMFEGEIDVTLTNRNQDRETEEIQCSPAVTHQDINRHCEYCPQRCDNCRRVMQKARVIVTETEKSVREDFQITCYCEHFSSCFSSGKRENKIVVQMVEGEIRVTTTERSQSRDPEQIRCNPAVTHLDINKYRDYCPKKCDNCRHLIQKTSLIVTETGESCRKDFEITCHGDHIALCFWSGSRGNSIVVQVVNGEIYVTTNRKTWNESLRSVFQRNRISLLGTFLCVAGMAMKTFGSSIPIPYLPEIGTALVLIGTAVSGADAITDVNTYQIT
ncbi:Hypothetical predicted protein [Paramuricea clavata]|uniref:Uncharacterized protein n=1 Tax=Paramuricea clavata TaxID=317549 RepID=A0A7D9EA66_PARCT|nr:Hypothetical predicted protein [Paramuricea clavata]